MGCISSKSSAKSFSYRAESPSSSYDHNEQLTIYNTQQPEQSQELLPTGPRICAGCNIGIGYGQQYKSSLNAFWHPECFCCEGCNTPISSYEFITCGTNYFHSSCYGHYPTCVVCKNYIPQPFDFGVISYQGRNAFWRQMFCNFHAYDGTPRCCSCERLMPQDTTIFNLEEDRNLCLECLDTAIMDTNQAQFLYNEIQRFYQGLDMELDQQVPLKLVGKQVLRKIIAKYGTHPEFDVRGVCERFMTHGEGNSNTHTVVTRILILSGLPRLYTGIIIAHETMHAWMAQNGYPILNPVVEEGICQVMGYMWLEDELSSLSSNNSMSPYERKFGEFLINIFESDLSPVYGHGFKQGQQVVRKYGLERTLEYIRETHNFPY